MQGDVEEDDDDVHNDVGDDVQGAWGRGGAA